MKSRLKFGWFDYAALLGYMSYGCCAMVLSVVLASMSRDLGFSLEDGNQGAGGALHLCRSLAMLLTMLCCAFLAGRFGKRLPLGLSLLLAGGGILLASFATNYLWVFLAIAISSFGQGGLEALMTSAVQEMHSHEDATRYINITHSIWSFGTVLVVMLSGLVLYFGISWRVVLRLIGILPIIPGLMFLRPRQFSQVTQVSSSPAEIWHQILEVLRCPRFWVFLFCLFLATGTEHCLSFWMPTYIGQAFHGNGLQCGLGTAIFAIGMSLGRFFSGALGDRQKIARILLGVAFCGIIFGLLIPFISLLPLFYLELLIMGLLTGPLWPSTQGYSLCRLNVNPTVLLILLPTIGAPGSGFFTWVLGFTGDLIGMRWGFLLVPTCFLLLATLLFCETKSRPAKD